MYGLSPLARGTLLCCVECNQCERFIPARAGNTAGYNPPFMTTSVYPRSRGEHSVASSTSNVRDGLSPLARGTRSHLRYLPGCCRFIPARAGNTAGRLGRHSARTVYPRSRGEHALSPAARFAAFGLSPLARGTRQLDRNFLRHLRFIPARAGNTAFPGSRTRPIAVYPRSRGEHNQIKRGLVTSLGLSPLARGTLNQVNSGRRKERFIPARAGNTRQDRCYFRHWPVYPRSRGEHLSLFPAGKSVTGLSPLARGTLKQGSCVILVLRFIPARAGNTPVSLTVQFSTAVYPRSRGEHLKPPVNPVVLIGLSPLARGTRVQRDANRRNVRFIPARAGNTLKLYTCIYYTFSCNNILPTFGSQSRIVKERITY